MPASVPFVPAVPCSNGYRRDEVPKAESANYPLSTMSYVHHIPVLHDVLLAFQAEGATGAGFGFGAGFEQLVPVNGFRANEMMLQVGVDNARGIHRFRPALDRPGAALIFTNGEE